MNAPVQTNTPPITKIIKVWFFFFEIVQRLLIFLRWCHLNQLAHLINEESKPEREHIPTYFKNCICDKIVGNCKICSQPVVNMSGELKEFNSDNTEWIISINILYCNSKKKTNVTVFVYKVTKILLLTINCPGFPLLVEWANWGVALSRNEYLGYPLPLWEGLLITSEAHKPIVYSNQIPSLQHSETMQHKYMLTICEFHLSEIEQIPAKCKLHREELTGVHVKVTKKEFLWISLERNWANSSKV